ncbi:DUF4936 family protein [Noviherbaspirillum cavernae]|uniref:DUF4936 family protein n=1 Tax=Noviherbaspirillum cavernae TaxID=2320862 RepID=A0A418X0Y9_9BURK|nr:DUF4936 family protein [Noviherbaspirillum cavernae]RJG06154.1 DUF4936 family protein [Noviherbaspirillum cavernae]
MTTDLYIYYRVRCEDAELLKAKVGAMQRCIFQEYGIVTGLKRRPEEKGGRHTWMEIYLAVPDDFEAILERAATQEKLDALIDGQRNIEYFLDYSTCA